MNLEELLFSLPPRTFTIVSAALGFLLIDDLDVNQQNSLGTFFLTIGQILQTNATQEQLWNNLSTERNCKYMHDDIERIKRTLNLEE